MKFSDFWLLYLQTHSLPATRAVHYLATAIGIGTGAKAVITLDPWIFPIGVVLGYALAIGSHRYIEHNTPLIRMAPVWGAIADLRMAWLALTGGLKRELAKLEGCGAADAAKCHQSPVYGPETPQ